MAISAESALGFLEIVGKLKLLKRTGWVRSGIEAPESVSEHMYRMAMSAMLIQDPTISNDRLVKVALVHDLAEAIVGDITPHDGVSAEEKRRLEETAIRSITRDLSNAQLEEEIISLWLEYENGTTPEAEVAKQLDKFEMVVQANEYEIAQGTELDSFFESTKDSFSHPQIVAWNDELRRRRQERLQK